MPGVVWRVHAYDSRFQDLAKEPMRQVSFPGSVFDDHRAWLQLCLSTPVEMFVPYLGVHLALGSAFLIEGTLYSLYPFLPKRAKHPIVAAT